MKTPCDILIRTWPRASQLPLRFRLICGTESLSNPSLRAFG